MLELAKKSIEETDGGCLPGWIIGKTIDDVHKFGVTMLKLSGMKGSRADQLIQKDKTTILINVIQIERMLPSSPSFMLPNDLTKRRRHKRCIKNRRIIRKGRKEEFISATHRSHSEK